MILGRPLWFDEAATYMMIDRSPTDLIRLVTSGDQAGMGLYFLLLRVWASAWGFGDGMLRSFSIIGGVVTAGASVELSRRWFGRRTAWLTGGLMIVNPFFIYYLSELRSYSWYMAAVVTATAAIHRAVRTGSLLWYAIYGFILGFGLGMHLGMVCFAAGHFAWIVWSRELNKRSFVGLLIAGLLSLSIVAAFVPATIRNPSQVSWIQALTLRSAAFELRSLGGGWLWAFFLCVGLGVVCWQSFVGQRNSSSALLVLAATVPVAVFLTASSIMAQSIFLGRYFAGVSPLLVTCGALFLSRAWNLSPAVRVAVASTCVLLTAEMIFANPIGSLPFGDLRASASYVEKHIEGGDAVIYYPTWSRLGIERYADSLTAADVAVSQWPAGRLQPSQITTKELRDVLNGYDRAWVLGWESSMGWRPFPDPVEPIFDDLQRQPTIERRDFDGFVVRLVDLTSFQG